MSDDLILLISYISVDKRLIKIALKIEHGLNNGMLEDYGCFAEPEVLKRYKELLPQYIATHIDYIVDIEIIFQTVYIKDDTVDPNHKGYCCEITAPTAIGNAKEDILNQLLSEQEVCENRIQELATVCETPEEDFQEDLKETIEYYRSVLRTLGIQIAILSEYYRKKITWKK